MPFICDGKHDCKRNTFNKKFNKDDHLKGQDPTESRCWWW